MHELRGDTGAAPGAPAFASLPPGLSTARGVRRADCGTAFAGLPLATAAPTSLRMPDTLSAVDRIDAAIARIESAIDARARAGDALARRHAALKARMAEAVSALDDVIARGSAS